MARLRTYGATRSLRKSLRFVRHSSRFAQLLEIDSLRSPILILMFVRLNKPELLPLLERLNKNEGDLAKVLFQNDRVP
jgi:hypothetical protein